MFLMQRSMKLRGRSMKFMQRPQKIMHRPIKSIGRPMKFMEFFVASIGWSVNFMGQWQIFCHRSLVKRQQCLISIGPCMANRGRCMSGKHRCIKNIGHPMRGIEWPMKLIGQWLFSSGVLGLCAAWRRWGWGVCWPCCLGKHEDIRRKAWRCVWLWIGDDGVLGVYWRGGMVITCWKRQSQASNKRSACHGLKRTQEEK